MIENIVFDVGRVLIDFSYSRFFAWMNQRGAQIRDEDDFSRRTGLLLYERDRITDQQFLDQLANLLDEPVEQEELIDRWNDLFTPVPGMLQLASGLKEGYGVFLLSNTSSLHWCHLWNRYSLGQISHDGVASYQIKALKPEAQAYRKVEERFGLNPESTVFIDDKKENVVGAIHCGWQGIHHQSAKATRERLQLLGVHLPDLPPETA